jgi:hypothetical protein
MSKYLSNVTILMNMGTSPKASPKLKNLNHCRIMWIKDSNKFQERIKKGIQVGLIMITGIKLAHIFKDL